MLLFYCQQDLENSLRTTVIICKCNNNKGRNGARSIAHNISFMCIYEGWGQGPKNLKFFLTYLKKYYLNSDYNVFQANSLIKNLKIYFKLILGWKLICKEWWLIPVLLKISARNESRWILLKSNKFNQKEKSVFWPKWYLLNSYQNLSKYFFQKLLPNIGHCQISNLSIFLNE